MTGARRIALGWAAVALALSTAEAETGRLQVRVLDGSGKTPLPGAQITLSSDSVPIAARTLVTDAEGEARFHSLPVQGRFRVEAYHPGYQRTRLSDIEIRADETTTLAVLLLPERKEVVEVKGERPLIELEETATSSRFRGGFLEDLPIQGRLYQEMLIFAPGVLDADEDGNPNVHGARDRDFKAVVSGVSNQDPLTGQYLGHVSMDSIEEIEVICAGAGVEYGRAQGGFANIVQKQGSNDFEGVASATYRSDELDGNGATNVPSSRLPEFDRWQPAFHVSGPIDRDRLWFRFTHELLAEDQPVDTLGDLVVTRREYQIHDDQITWQASTRNKLAFQFRRTPAVQDRFGVSSLTPPESSVRIETGGPTYSVSWTAPMSPRLLLESQTAYQDASYNRLPSVDGVASRCVLGWAPLERAQCTDSDTGVVSGSSPIVWRDRRQRFTARTSGTLRTGRRWGMSHLLKFGFQIENERYFRTLDQRPSFVFDVQEVGVVIGPDGKPIPIIVGIADATMALPQVSTVRATGTAWGLYVEDKVLIGSGLGLTLGVRLDREHVDSNGFDPFDPAAEGAEYLERLEAGANATLAIRESFTGYGTLQGPGSLDELFREQFGVGLPFSAITIQSAFWNKVRRPGNLHIVRSNLAPRLALSWDPWRDGKTKLSLTAGRYYDKIFLAVPTLELPPLSADVRFIGGVEGFEPPRAWKERPNGQAFNPGANVHTVDRGLRTPYQDEITLGLERELPVPETSIRLTHVRRHFRDQLQDVDVNNVPVGEGLPIFYKMNPGWGRILLVGNSDDAEYGAWVLELTRRQYRSWQLEGSYTYSRAVGDAEDYLIGLGDIPSPLGEERGYLSYDVRHVLKINWTSQVPWLGGFRLGAAVSWQSGLPYSRISHVQAFTNVPPSYGFSTDGQTVTRTVYVTGRRNDQRSPAYWNVDARAAKEIALSKRRSLQLTAEIFNLLNDNTIVIWNPLLRYGQVVDGRLEATRRFGRQFQVGFRLAF